MDGLKKHNFTAVFKQMSFLLLLSLLSVATILLLLYSNQSTTTMFILPGKGR
jgi:hypothetical protein